MRDILLGPYRVADDAAPILVVEIGAMFNQDLDLAFRLVDRVAEARDAEPYAPLILKTEILNDPEVCLDDDSTQVYQSKSGKRKEERYRDLIERKVLTLETYARILDRCKSHGLSVLVSVYTQSGAEFARDQGCVALKTNSGNVTNIAHIRMVASMGLPIIIDTGKAYLSEVDVALRQARGLGNDAVILQHSPDGHPAPPQNHNMRTLATLKQAFDVHTGLSCHGRGVDYLVMAVTLGAKILEKNFVEEDWLLEQDYAISEPITNLNETLRRIDNAWEAMGAPFRNPETLIHLISRNSRYGLVAAMDLKPGEVLNSKTVKTAFPCKGVPAERYDDAMGWTIERPVAQGCPIRWSDIAMRPGDDN